MLGPDLPDLAAVVAGFRAGPSRPPVVLAGRLDADVLASALQQGAAGWLDLDAPSSRLGAYLTVVLGGGLVLPPAARSWFRDRLATALNPARAEYGLSPRERDVLAEMTRGYTQKQIAVRLFISPSTVNSHVQRVYEKLHVCTASAAVAKALRERLGPLAA